MKITELGPSTTRTPVGRILHPRPPRFLKVRPRSLAIDLQDELRSAFGSAGAARIRAHVGRVLGSEDARAKESTIDSLVDYFEEIGWGTLACFPFVDDQYCTALECPDTFESAELLAQGIPSDEPACVMCTGYIAGWLDADVKEVECRVRGDARCLFVTK